MLRPESALQQLVEQLEDGVREKEAELADFEKRAQQHVNALRKDLLRKRKRIELFRHEMADMRTEACPATPFDLTITTDKESFGIEIKTIGDQASQSARIRAAAKVILRDAGRPMMQKEIESEIKSRGIQIFSTRLIELIRAALRRGPEFKHIKNEGWILTDVDVGR